MFPRVKAGGVELPSVLGSVRPSKSAQSAPETEREGWCIVEFRFTADGRFVDAWVTRGVASQNAAADRAHRAMHEQIVKELAVRDWELGGTPRAQFRVAYDLFEGIKDVVRLDPPVR
jgi:hypothetical protein